MDINFSMQERTPLEGQWNGYQQILLSRDNNTMFIFHSGVLADGRWGLPLRTIQYNKNHFISIEADARWNDFLLLFFISFFFLNIFPRWYLPFIASPRLHMRHIVV